MGEAQNMLDTEEGSLLVGMGEYYVLSFSVNFKFQFLCNGDLEVNLKFLDWNQLNSFSVPARFQILHIWNAKSNPMINQLQAWIYYVVVCGPCTCTLSPFSR